MLESKIHMIGICGPKGSGKSEAARTLGRSAGFSRHRFAGPIKRAMKEAFGLTDDHVDGDLKEIPTPLLHGLTPRDVMKSMGTEWGRNMIHKDIWVTAWRNTMPTNNSLGGEIRVAVDDVRFPNEAEMLRTDYDATIIRIVRPGFESDTSHESEAHSIEAEFEIVNDKSIEEFRNELCKIAIQDIARRRNP